MTQSSSSNNASASSSAPPPLQQFTLEELIRVLQNHRIEVISPHQQMQNEIDEQRQIESDLREQLAIERSLNALSATNPPTDADDASVPERADSPAAPAPPLSAPSVARGHASDEATEGSWTLFHTNNIPTAVLTGGSSQLTSPIPTSLIDTIIAGLIQARVENGDGPGTSTLDPKGKQKEEPEDDNTNDYKLVAPPPTTDITGFVCAKCKAHNLVRPSSDSWYVVTVGREVGVFSGWPTVQPLVIGVSGSCYKRYKSEADAKAAFKLAQAAGTVHVVP